MKKELPRSLALSFWAWEVDREQKRTGSSHGVVLQYENHSKSV